MLFVLRIVKKILIPFSSFFGQMLFRIRYNLIHRISGAYGSNYYDYQKMKATTFLKNKKIAIYTCITGKYDILTDPEYVNDTCDYYVFSDNPVYSTVWKRKNIPSKLDMLSDTNKNRYIKLHPNDFFKGYDYTIYIDGNVVIKNDIIKYIVLINKNVSIAGHFHSARDCAYDEAKMCLLVGRGSRTDIKLLIKKYKKEHFPRHYGLAECTLLFTIINDQSKTIYDKWWSAFLDSKTNRDQLVLPYVLWTKNIKMKDFCTLGTNLHKSTDFYVLEHKPLKK